MRKSLLAWAKPRLTDTSRSYLPGGRPPVPPAAGSDGPDRKSRDLFRPIRADAGCGNHDFSVDSLSGGDVPPDSASAISAASSANSSSKPPPASDLVSPPTVTTDPVPDAAGTA